MILVLTLGDIFQSVCNAFLCMLAICVCILDSLLMYIFIYVFIYEFIDLSINLFICWCVSLSIHLFIFFTFVSLCSFILPIFSLSFCISRSIHLYIYSLIYFFVYIFIYPKLGLQFHVLLWCGLRKHLICHIWVVRPTTQTVYLRRHKLLPHAIPIAVQSEILLIRPQCQRM